MLLKINERGRWTDPPPLDINKREKQDEEIFQTARLVKYVCAPINFLAALLIIFSLIYHLLGDAYDLFSCGHFMGMIFGDYVAGFLGLPRDGNTWSMNPFDVRQATNFVGLISVAILKL